MDEVQRHAPHAARRLTSVLLPPQTGVLLPPDTSSEPAGSGDGGASDGGKCGGGAIQQEEAGGRGAESEDFSAGAKGREVAPGTAAPHPLVQPAERLALRPRCAHFVWQHQRHPCVRVAAPATCTCLQTRTTMKGRTGRCAAAAGRPKAAQAAASASAARALATPVSDLQAPPPPPPAHGRP